uniref:Putative secreted protein n=1 Tax=Anopheles marajoara TaxID=58244 RepID=A0A2M4CAH8_9DIPT
MNRRRLRAVSLFDLLLLRRGTSFWSLGGTHVTLTTCQTLTAGRTAFCDTRSAANESIKIYQHSPAVGWTARGVSPFSTTKTVQSM